MPHTNTKEPMYYIGNLKKKLDHPDTDPDYKFEILMAFADTLIYLNGGKGDVFELLKRMKGLDDNGR